MDANQLKEFFQGEVLTDTNTLETYSHDASIFEVKPEIIVRPKNVSDLKNLVAFVAREKKKNPTLSLTARSAGTDMSGGPLNNSIIVDFTAHFNRIIDVSPAGATVEPGVYYRNFEAETLKKNLLLPSYPASKSICTVGGMVANNSGGEKSLTYGKTENYIQSLEVVMSDGEVYTVEPLSKQELMKKKRQKNFEGNLYREMYDLLEKNYDLIKKAKPNVSKNSAGYYLWNVWDKETFDLTKLIVGSQGTLGFVTKIRFRLVPTKSHSQLLVIFLNDLSKLGEIVDDILPYHPETFESYDDNTFKLAIKFFPDLLKRMKGGILKLGLLFIPELWLTLTGGVPKLVLIAEFTGNTEEEVLKKATNLKTIIAEKFKVKCHVTHGKNESQKYWVMRRESFNLLRQHVQGLHTAPFIDDIVVRPHDLPTFLPRLDRLIEPYKQMIMYTIAGHAGDGNFHIIPLMDFKDPKERAIILDLSDKVYSLVAEYKGSITGEHNDGIIRTPYLSKMYPPPIMKLFEKTKKIFDPQDIFNPHKKIGGSIEAITRYMKKS